MCGDEVVEMELLGMICLNFVYLLCEYVLIGGGVVCLFMFVVSDVFVVGCLVLILIDYQFVLLSFVVVYFVMQ